MQDQTKRAKSERTAGRGKPAVGALSGIIPALFTPFTKDDKLNLEILPAHLQFLLDAGCAGFFVSGSTGEGFLQTAEERIRFARAVMRTLRGRAPVILHVGAMNPGDARRLAAAAGEMGAAAISSVMPFYYNYAMDEIAAYYREIQAASGLPMIIYYLPDNTNRVVTLDQFCGSLLTLPGVIGVKYTHADLYQMQMLAALSPRPIALFGGYDQMGVCFLTMGAQALIGSTYNVIPDLFVALHRAFRAGRVDEACALQLRINRFMQALKQYGNRAYYAALQARGIDIGWPRRTGREITRKDFKAIESLVKGVVLE